MWLDLSPDTHLSKTECSHLWAGCTLQVSLLGWDPPGAACSLGRSVCPAGPISRGTLYPFSGPCVPRSVTTITTPPSLECINYASIQTVPPAIPTWCSYLRTNHIAHLRGVCVFGGQTLSHHYLHVLYLYFSLNGSYKSCKDSGKGSGSIKSHKSVFRISFKVQDPV